MKPVMTDEQRIFFETNGYLVIPDALDAAELARVRAAADRAEAVWRADPSRLGQRNPNLEQVQAPIEYDDVFLDLLAHPKVFPIVREILGDDVSMIDNDYFISPPRTGTHAHWHHDVGMAGVSHPRSVLMVKVFYLLTDVSTEGGGTAILPGSRRILIYNYGHFWMKIWQGYEPSEALKAKATTPVMKQLLGIGDAYGTALR